MSSIVNGQQLKFKYLFTATFADGHVIKQTPADVSESDPKKSAFFDVVEYEKISPVVKFSLRQSGMLGLIADSIEVDLRTGLFLVNGLQLNVAEQNFEPVAPLRIVYFRENRVEQDVSFSTREVVGERFFINQFFIGWQTSWKNKNYQCTIAVDGK